MSKTTTAFAVLAFISGATACARPALLADGRVEFALRSERAEIEDAPRHPLRPRLDERQPISAREFRRELSTTVAALER